jgi:hypothetical protein
VVLVSFGSIVDVSKMNKELRDAFLQAFASFPEYEFIWKMGNSSDFRNYANVHPMNWVEQTAVLGKFYV